MNIPYLTSIVIFLPLLGAIITMMLRSTGGARMSALIFTSATFLLSVGLYAGFDPAVSTTAAPQLADQWAGWFPDW